MTATVLNSRALELNALSKRFHGNWALRDVSMTVEAGEIHGLLGENGSGKSTLVKCLTGYHSPDSGKIIRWGGELSLPIAHPHQHGIAVVHQDPGLVDDLSVLDNLGVTRGYNRALLAPVSPRSEARIFQRHADQLGIGINIHARVSELGPAERTMVAILRAVRDLEGCSGRPLLVLDEPTAALSADDAVHVTALMQRLAKQGASVIFISHRLNEVIETTDRITVLRDGQKVATLKTPEVTAQELVATMLGRDLGSFYPNRPAAPKTDPVLSIRGLSGSSIVSLDLDIHAGEIVGVTGLVGMGHERLPYLVAGAERRSAGSIIFEGRTLRSGVGQARRVGVVLVPGNRQRDASWSGYTAQTNVNLPVIGKLGRGGWLSTRRERRNAVEIMKRMNVRPRDPNLPFENFSGGNQQKMVIGMWAATAPRMWILHEPTQGVDAAARRDILEHIVGSARSGIPVMMVSGDHEQLVAVCHRVLVVRDGRVIAQLRDAELTEESILRAYHVSDCA